MVHPNPDQALSKCIVYFYDGNSRTFYSFDKKHRKSKPNYALGIRRLEKMLLQHFKGTWETAIIYENKENGRELAKFKNGIKIF
ncbi:hypothetical protein [uncultured Aquimarina sp.]|uniref:hypothetical protein n=1 Tax=uncultured Aquimarina sp. TaxID=575652 RepID=UPI002604967E|nr:hypothetical protein [uncultured Aquimarina sp.]